MNNIEIEYSYAIPIGEIIINCLYFVIASVISIFLGMFIQKFIDKKSKKINNKVENTSKKGRKGK